MIPDQEASLMVYNSGLGFIRSLMRPMMGVGGLLVGFDVYVSGYGCCRGCGR